MAEFTGIQWCDATLNPWWGCTKVSEGCRFCYAETLSDQRYKKGAWGPKGTRQEVKSWRSSLEKISKRAKAENRRLKVFCSSMADVFEGPETCGGIDSENWQLMELLRLELWCWIEECPELDFLLLTKRPENFWKVGLGIDGQPGLLAGGMPSNVWLGTSVENQSEAEERIPHLLAVPAAIRFLSCEPLLGKVRLDRLVDGELGANFDALATGMIHWVICGGESGPNARPMHPDWARAMRDQCQKAGVPFHFKQYGASSFAWRVGKKAAGRELDGRTWDEFPQVKP